MTESQTGRAAARRAHAEREILDAAWAHMADEGVAALSVREVARSVGIRQQSLTYYFPTKHDLLDALFADGFAELQRMFDQLPAAVDPIVGVEDLAVALVDHFVDNPAAYHLMFQRTIPAFEPSDSSHQVALGALAVLVERLAAAGITEDADRAVVRSLVSGIIAEQIANDPTGRLFADQTRRAVRHMLTALRSEPHPPARRSRRTSSPP